MHHRMTLGLAIATVVCSSVLAATNTVTVKLSADSAAKGYEAARAMDGDRGTMWHSIWGNGQSELPHELVVDLGASYTVTGFVHQARHGNANGTIKGYEFFVSDDAKQPGEPVAKGTFANKNSPERVGFPEVRGRYVTLRALSEVRGNRIYTSVAELDILSPGVEFKGPALPKKKPAVSNKPVVKAKDVPRIADPASEAEAVYNVLADDLKRAGHVNRYADQTFHLSSLILDTDRDPFDIILRRTRVLLEDIGKMPKAPSTAGEEQALAALEKKASSVDVKETEQRQTLFKEAFELRRKIAFSNPLLDFDELLFIKRERARFNHMCDQYYGTFAVPGGGLFVLSNPFGDDAEEFNVLENSVVESGRLKGQKLDSGGFLSPELSYDGKTVYFAYVECTGPGGHIRHLDHANRGHWSTGRCYHVFSVATDGTGLAQLTDGTWNDFDPCPLPNGRIAFISERRGGYLRCGRACPSYTVYDMKPDGSDIRIMSPHENNEWHPSVSHDGMIIYTRWDYVDRHGCTAHHPWIMTADGRDSRAMHGNFAPRRQRPDMELDLRAIPGSHKIGGTAAPHHGQSYGSIIVYDPKIPDDDGMGPVKRLTPEVGFPESQGGKQVYGTPWPLSEKYYLCVYDAAMREGTARQGTKHRKGNYGIYLVDAFGNKVLIHRTDIACLSPMPLRPRKMPPVMPEKSKRLADDPPKEGTMAVIDVYESLKPWPEGTKIKALRIYQTFSMSVPSGGPPHETGRRLRTAGDSVNLARRIIGTVPVEEDGSAYFVVPALRELYFQALDEDGLAIQSMRSATWVQPAEELVCQGCHEPKNPIPEQPDRTAIALQRPPSVPEPDVDGTNPFSYPRLVQPVLDKKCVACHEKGVDGKKGPPLDSQIVKLGGRGRTNVYRSYESLIHKHAFWNYGDSYRTTPGKFGAKASKLYPMLVKGHHGAKLTKEEMHRITVWLDSVSNFYGVYEKEGGIAQLRGEVVLPTLE